MMKFTLRIEEESAAQAVARFHTFRIRPRMPGFGAWIDGVDLAGELPQAIRTELRQALLDYGVLFFREQKKLTPNQHASLGHVFGGGAYEGNAQLARSAENAAVELLVSDEARPPYADSWHTDISWKARPPLGTLIQIQDRPALGGNTCWSSTRKAYNCLSPAAQEFFGKLKAVHSHVTPKTLSENSFSREKMEAILKADAPVVHPVVMRHPLTGVRSIYVNELWTINIVDMHPSESAGLLKMLYDWMRMPEFQLHHEWETNGVAVWDNFTTQHYAQADYYPAYRVNQRLTFSTPEPQEELQSP